MLLGLVTNNHIKTALFFDNQTRKLAKLSEAGIGMVLFYTLQMPQSSLSQVPISV